MSSQKANRYLFRSGCFALSFGKVSEIDKGKGTLKVIIEVFGKSELVELSFFDVEKISY